MEGPAAKKAKHSDDSDTIQVGDPVRLVNLPSFPGLEGLTADVVNISNFDVDVKLRKNGVVKRVCLSFFFQCMFLG
jgi:hypothetical protein